MKKNLITFMSIGLLVFVQALPADLSWVSSEALQGIGLRPGDLQGMSEESAFERVSQAYRDAPSRRDYPYDKAGDIKKRAKPGAGFEVLLSPGNPLGQVYREYNGREITKMAKGGADFERLELPRDGAAPIPVSSAEGPYVARDDSSGASASIPQSIGRASSSALLAPLPTLEVSLGSAGSSTRSPRPGEDGLGERGFGASAPNASLPREAMVLPGVDDSRPLPWDIGASSAVRPQRALPPLGQFGQPIFSSVASRRAPAAAPRVSELLDEDEGRRSFSGSLPPLPGITGRGPALRERESWSKAKAFADIVSDPGFRSGGTPSPRSSTPSPRQR